MAISTIGQNGLTVPLTSNTITSASATALTLQSAGTTAVTIDTSQNVGIGTTSPAISSLASLNVKGNGSNSSIVTAQSSDAASSVAIYSGNNSTDNPAVLFQNSLRFGTTTGLGTTGYTERARIDSSGNLLVGQTSQTGSEKIGVTQSGATSATAYFYATAGNYSNAVITARCARGSATTEYNFLECNQVSTLQLVIRANGNVVNTNNSYGAISDVKLKENITDATPKLADLMQVKVRNYNLKTEPDHKQLGVIAQELEQVFPSMIEEALDKDEEGNDLGTTTKSVKYSVFIPMLIKSIQELKAINDQQAETINALTARIEALENK